MNVQPSLSATPTEHTLDRRKPLGRPALLIPALALLAACGGGGGGGTGGDGATASGGSASGAGSSDTVQLLALTDANAKASAYNAIVSISNPGPESGAKAVVAGTKAQAEGAGTLAHPTHLALSLARLATSGWRGGNTKAAVNETVACDGGGTVRAEGEMAAPPDLSAGDRVTLIATNCKASAKSDEIINGRVAVTVQALGTEVNDVSFEYDAFSLKDSEFDITLWGDSRLRSSSTSSAQITGTRLTLSTTAMARTALLRWLDYRLASEPVNGVSGRSLAARVETLDSRLGTGWVGYTLSTPSPARRELSGGAVRLQGQGSAMLVEFGVGGNATLQLDADGNGTYERSTTYTLQQLATP